jgi:hypothetical protein
VSWAVQKAELEEYDSNIIVASGMPEPVEQIETAIETIGNRFKISACAIASYDPQYDRDDHVLRSVWQLSKAS